MVFHRSLNGSKSPQVSRNLLCILANLNKAVVWMVSTRPLISKSSSSDINTLATVSSALITNSITVTLMFKNVSFPWQGLRTYPYFLFLSSGQQSPQFGKFSFLLSITYYYHFFIEFFTSSLADGLFLDFEWQLVSSRLQDSSQYSSRSQQCCNLDGLHSSSQFQVLQSL